HKQDIKDKITAVIKRSALYLVSYLAVTCFTFYLFGGFYGNITADAEGLGLFSANLNSLFNPIDYSLIIKEFPLTGGQYEGLSYIGIAAIVLLIPTLLYLIKNARNEWRGHRNLIISALFTCVILWIIALSPVVTAGSHVLFEIPLPGFLYNAWSMFRASGRFLWPVMYAVILTALYYSERELKLNFIIVLLIGCLLQLYEFSGKVAEVNNNYADLKVASFNTDHLDMLDWEGIEHVQFMHDYYFGEFYGDEIRNQMIGYAEFALRNGMTISNFHFSRDDMDGVRRYIRECENDLRNGQARSDTMYVFRKEDDNIIDMNKRFKGVKFIHTDDMIIVVKDR
ncbi:MAG: hypothetical protein K6G03_08690, partial [Lachnospiraceae bacterium]|nr:hypothetical protein [Lachnospiraceae bacterium]